MRNVKVAERIKELQAMNREDCRWDRKRRLDFLCDILETPAGTIETPAGTISPDDPLCQEYREPGERVGALIKISAKLDAFDKLAKMNGWYEPEKLDLGVSDPVASLIKSIRDRGTSN